MFNEIQLDMLREYINVSFGSATANIAELLDAFAKLHIPTIEIMDAEHLDKYLLEKARKEVTYQAQQIFNGQISGETVLIVDNDSADHIAKHLYSDIELTEEYVKDSLLELNNILSVTNISKLSELTGLDSKFLPPTLKVVKDGNFLEKAEIQKYPSVIVISTVLEFEDEEIKCCYYILTTEKMMGALRDSMDKIIKEQFPDYEG